MTEQEGHVASNLEGLSHHARLFGAVSGRALCALRGRWACERHLCPRRIAREAGVGERLDTGEDEPRAEGRRAFDDDEAAQRPGVRQEVRLFQREMHRALRPIRGAQPPAQREVFARRADPSTKSDGFARATAATSARDWGRAILWPGL
jgi:hypothetical protein